MTLFVLVSFSAAPVKEPFRQKISASVRLLGGVSGETHKRAGVQLTRPLVKGWSDQLHPQLLALRQWLHVLRSTMSEKLLPAPMLLSLDDAAMRLSVCRRTLEREIAAGHFPRPLKIGSATRVPLDDLQAYVAKLSSQRLQR